MNILIVNGLVLKHENEAEAEKLVLEHLQAREELANALDKVTNTLKAIQEYKPIYSIEGIDTKQTFTEFT